MSNKEDLTLFREALDIVQLVRETQGTSAGSMSNLGLEIEKRLQAISRAAAEAMREQCATIVNETPYIPKHITGSIVQNMYKLTLDSDGGV